MNVNSYSYSNSSLSSVLHTSAKSNTYHNGVTGWVKMGGTGSKDSTSSSSSGVSGESQGYLDSVQEFGAKINDALLSLSGNGDSAGVFGMLKATSSDTDAVTVKVKDQDKASAFNAGNGEKTLSVQQLATKQKNSGTMVSSAAVSNVNKGNNSFTIEKGGESYQFNVSVNTTDSNRTVQEKMAAAINDQNIGVKASVVYNENDKTSSIVLSGTETGEQEAFEISDAGGGNIVSEMGAGNTVTEAKDAKYTQDGVQMTSSKNEVDLGDGIIAELKKVTDEEVTVGTANETENATNAIYDLVNGFNQLRETALDSDDSGAIRLQDRLDSISSAYSATLKRAGITMNSEGYLQIDKEKLSASIESGEAERIFGEDSGFTRSLSGIAKQAESDPGRFLSADARNGQDQTTAEEVKDDYFDIMDSANFSNYQNNQLMRWENVSMLLDAFV